MVPAQTHTGDYNNAGYPFHCQPIGGEEGSDLAITPEGALTSEDPELEVYSFLLQASRSLLGLDSCQCLSTSTGTASLLHYHVSGSKGLHCCVLPSGICHTFISLDVMLPGQHVLNAHRVCLARLWVCAGCVEGRVEERDRLQNDSGAEYAHHADLE